MAQRICEPFCYVAEKNGIMYGVVVGREKQLVKEFYTEFAGYTIKPLETRAEYNTYCETVPMFGEKQ